MFKTLSLPKNFSANEPASARPRNFAQNKVARFKPANKFVMAATLTLAALNFLALLGYVAGVNSNASKGYEIKRLQSKISLLTDQNEQLNLKVSESSSMVAIQTDFLNSKFVTAGQVRYLQADPVAMK